MKRVGKLGAALASALIAVASSVAFAGPVLRELGPNLVTNGSFETTSSIAGSGWTVSGFTAEGFDYFVDTSAADAQSGTHSFAGGAVGGFGLLSQSLATTPGQHYNIHLWLANLSGFADGTALEVLWGGNVVYSATDILGFGYHEIVIDPLATSASTLLSIGLQDDSFFLNVDSVSVRLVPEPATVALLLSGLAAAGWARRHRRS